MGPSRLAGYGQAHFGETHHSSSLSRAPELPARGVRVGSAAEQGADAVRVGGPLGRLGSGDPASGQRLDGGRERLERGAGRLPLRGVARVDRVVWPPAITSSKTMPTGMLPVVVSTGSTTTNSPVGVLGDSTVTVNESLLSFPDASDAVHETVVVPSAKNAPDAGEHTTVGL